MSQSCCNCCRKINSVRCWRACGVIWFILTIFSTLALACSLTDELYFLILKKELPLIPHSSTLDEWTNCVVPTYKKYFLYDTQNPSEFSSGAVPVVKLIGPFTYRKFDIKHNLTWNDDESLVTWLRDEYYVFIPEKSIGDPHDYTVTTLNIPLLVVLSQQKKIDNLLFKILGSSLAQVYITLIGDQNLFIKKTAQEVLWGYYDPLFQMLTLLGALDSPYMAAEQNTTARLVYKSNTGKKDLKQIAHFVQWRNETEIMGWNSKAARHLYGSLGQFVKPRLKKHDTVLVFVEQIYRHVDLIWKGETRKKHGIETYHYVAPHNVFCNSSQYPPNVGYYADDYNYGLVNISSFNHGLPLFISKPHCLDCDPDYFNNVSSYHPDRSEHDSFYDYEPFTGFCLDAALRGQTNVRIERIPLSSQLSRVRDETFYPWFYFSIERTVTKDKANEFKRMVQIPRLVLHILMIMLLCLSGGATLCIGGLLFRLYYISRTTGSGYQSKSFGESPVGINNSTSPLLNDSKDGIQDYHTIRQSTL